MSNPEKVKGRFVAFRDVIIHSISKQAVSHRILLLSGLLIGAVLVIVIVYRCPSKSQYQILRIITAVSLSGFSSVLPNLLRVKAGDFLRLSGALIVFLIAFGWNPAGVIVADDCYSRLHLTGTVWLGQEPLSGAIVQSPELNERDQTNDQGAFDLPFNKEFLTKEIQVIVRYNGLVK